MKEEKLKKISEKLSVNRDNYMDSFRKNLDLYITQTDFTIRSLSEKAEVPFSTLNNILYGNLSDCKVSTIVHLACALHITIDELLGSGTLSDGERQALSSARRLPEHSRYLIQWFIRRQLELQKGNRKKKEKIIPIMRLEKDINGNLYPSNNYDKLNITYLSDDKRPQIFLGIQTGCDYYMPFYSPYDILLIANNRNPRENENSVIIYGKQVFILHRHVEYTDGVEVAKYYSIRDGKFRVNEEDIDEVIGYIAHIHHNENELLTCQP